MFEMLKKKQKEEDTLYNRMLSMKGQATPIFGYYVLRDIILKEITGEYQASILYWIGKRIAAQAEVQSFEQLRDYFLELGWGLLKQTHKSGHMLRYVLQSPFFYLRDWKKNKESFALECGFLAEAISIIEKKDTEGEFTLKTEEKKELVEFIIYLQPKITKADFENSQIQNGQSTAHLAKHNALPDTQNEPHQQSPQTHESTAEKDS